MKTGNVSERNENLVYSEWNTEQQKNTIAPTKRRNGKTLQRMLSPLNERTANKNNEQNSKIHATRPSTENKNKKKRIPQK